MYKETLQQIVGKIDGCQGAVIMGTDGIPVEEVWQTAGFEANLDVAVAEMTALIRTAGRISDDTGMGKLRELTVVNDTAAFLLRLVGPEYFLVLVLDATGIVGRARYELRCAELVLESELTF